MSVTYRIQIDKVAATISLPSSKARRLLLQAWHPWIVKKATRPIAIKLDGRIAPSSSWIRTILRDPPKGYDLVFPTSNQSSVSLLQVNCSPMRGVTFFPKHLRAAWIYYGALELVFHSLLRRKGFFPLHGAGVYSRRRGILILGEAGAGKSTTVALLLVAGCLSLSDDDIILRFEGHIPEALGREAFVAVEQEALKKYPSLSTLKGSGWRCRQGHVKKLLTSDSDGAPQPRPLARAPIRVVIFPCVRTSRKTCLKRLSRRAAFLRLLSQRPNAWQAYPADTLSVRNFLGLYESLATKAECYELTLGKDAAGIPRILTRLLGRAKSNKRSSRALAKNSGGGEAISEIASSLRSSQSRARCFVALRYLHFPFAWDRRFE